MATSANRSRIFPARSKKAYRLEMEGRTLYLLLTLMVLTGVVVFYLGVVTGKAIRDPNAPVPLSAEMRAPREQQAASGGKTGLAFNDTLIEGLRVQQESVTQRTRELLDRGQKELELREVSATSPSGKDNSNHTATLKTPQSQPGDNQRNDADPARPVPKAAPEPRRQTATPPAARTEIGGVYTVQVFSSRREKNARELVTRLKNKGFAAYLNRFQSADKNVWYRVRVGRSSRAEAESLSSRLKNEENLKDPQIRKL